MKVRLRAVRLVVIDGAPPHADARLPARLRAAARGLRAPIVVLASSREPTWSDRHALIASGHVDDVMHEDTERVDALMAAWSLHSDRCRRKVEALRLAHQSTPAPLHQFLEELLLNDSADLSVAAWAASKPDSSRFQLRRQLAREGIKPTVLVNVARVLNAVARNLGMTPTDVSDLAIRDGDDAVRDRTKRAVGEMLRGSDDDKPG